VLGLARVACERSRRRRESGKGERDQREAATHTP